MAAVAVVGMMVLLTSFGVESAPVQQGYQPDDTWCSVAIVNGTATVGIRYLGDGYDYIFNCHYYYKCSNGRTYLMQCPNDLYFNSHQQKCDTLPTLTLPGITRCESSAEIITGDDFCLTHAGINPYPGNCHQFYLCYYLTYRMTCPDNKYFDSVDHKACVTFDQLSSARQQECTCH